MLRCAWESEKERVSAPGLLLACSQKRKSLHMPLVMQAWVCAWNTQAMPLYPKTSCRAVSTAVVHKPYIQTYRHSAHTKSRHAQQQQRAPKTKSCSETNTFIHAYACSRYRTIVSEALQLLAHFTARGRQGSSNMGQPIPPSELVKQHMDVKAATSGPVAQPNLLARTEPCSTAVLAYGRTPPSPVSRREPRAGPGCRTKGPACRQ
jgi:hypothetical protein